MTFEIHDAFKVGDEVKDKENGMIGIVVYIEEYNVLYPYKVKNKDGSFNIHSRNSIFLHKQAPQTQAFKLYDKVELVDPQDPLFGKKGIVGYVGIKEDKETKYRIQNEEKTQLWHAYESQIKLVSDEKEDKPHHNDSREMNKQHLIGFKDGQEVKVEPNGVCTMSNNNLGIIVSAPKADKTEPSHYKNQSIETIDMMVRIWGAKAVVLFCEINAFNYRMISGSKEGESIEDDIKKAQWYEQRANELRE